MIPAKRSYGILIMKELKAVYGLVPKEPPLFENSLSISSESSSQELGPYFERNDQD